MRLAIHATVTHSLTHIITCIWGFVNFCRNQLCRGNWTWIIGIWCRTICKLKIKYWNVKAVFIVFFLPLFLLNLREALQYTTTTKWYMYDVQGYTIDGLGHEYVSSRSNLTCCPCSCNWICWPPAWAPWVWMVWIWPSWSAVNVWATVFPSIIPSPSLTGPNVEPIPDGNQWKEVNKHLKMIFFF